MSAKLSILTPSYNQVRWLPDNLASVACQSYPTVEHIVMDGGSNDGTVEVLRETSGVDWESEKDRGQSHALNKAFQRSTGEIIGWLNSDDAYFDCDVFAEVMEVFDHHPEVDVVYGHSAYVNEWGLLLHYFWAPRFSAGMLRRYDFIIQPAVFVRRSALRDRLVDESYHFAMDYELWLRLLKSGARFHRIDRVLAIDRAQRMRKSMTILDVLESDMQRLRDEYGVAQGKPARLLSALHAVWCRLCGASLVLRQVNVGSLAFSAATDGRWATLRRQCFTRRRNMEVGE